MSQESTEETESEYSDQLLEETPPRAAKFLNGIGKNAVIRTLMESAGMHDEAIDEGGQLLVNTWSFKRRHKIATDTPAAKAQRKAVADLDQWDEPHFARFKATLKRHFPSAKDYVFENLKAGRGAEAVASVSTFLTRINDLELGKATHRADRRQEDKAAVALLADRGLTQAERQRLADLVTVALEPTTPLDTGAFLSEAEHKRRRHQALVILKDWFEEWTTAARTVVKNRNHLILLGLAKRKGSK